jgi:DNA polymerase-3 subunit beta
VLTLTATDLETTYISTMECVSDKPFQFCIEYPLISELAGKVKLPLEFDVTEKSISAKSGVAKFKLSVAANPGDFPRMPEDSFDFSFDVGCDFFFNLSNANTARSKEDLKANFNKAAIHVEKNQLSVVGTNSNELYLWRIPAKNKKEFVSMVSDNFVQTCSQFQDAKISIGEKFIKAECQNDIVISRLPENKFVDYKSIMPSEIIYNMVVSKSELKNAIDQVGVTANLKSKQGVFVFEPGVVKIKTNDIDFGNEGETEIEVEHSVEVDAIGLNTTMLLHLLSLIDGEQVEMAFEAPHKAVYLRPIESESTLCLLMPLMIN